MVQVLRRRPGTAHVAWAVGVVLWLGLWFSGFSWKEVTSAYVAAAAAVVAGVLCLRTGRSMEGERRLGWRLLGIGSMAWGLGNAGWPVYLLVRGSVPLPSLVDLGCLSLIPCMMLGAFFLIGRRRGALRIVFDGLLISGSLLLLSWTTAFGATIQQEQHGWARAIVLAYPLGDVAIATMMLILLIHDRHGQRRSIAMVCTGMLALCAADSGYAYFSANGLNGFGFFAYTGWAGGFALVGLGARSASQHAPAAAREMSPRWLALPYAPAALALSSTSIRYFRTGEVSSFPAVMALGLIALVMIRQMVALKDNVRLSSQLAKTVADLQHSEGQLHHMAFYDQLTGLANRAHFYRTAEALFTPGPASDQPIAVLFIDLDHFKPVNDRLGHAAGDELLALVAERLRSNVRDSDVIARLGGDEFAVLLGEVPSDAVIQTIAARLLSELSRPFTVVGESVSIGASIGMVIESDRRTSLDHLLARADSAMYEAKSGGRSRLVAAA
jgi:diguanylate cyclase (GGDEF)-like protein